MKNEQKLVKLPNIQRQYPAEEFICGKYDKASGDKLKTIILLLSTPRSGSTLLCDLIYKSIGVLGHEYFQPHGYIQELAKRWNVLEDGCINVGKFIESLIYYRAKNGILCINLHGSHIKLFMKFLTFIPSCTFKFVHLKRKSIVPQAVSFVLAEQTGQWSSIYGIQEDLISPREIKPSAITKKVNIINEQNLIIEKFLGRINEKAHVLFFEDLVSYDTNTLKEISDYLNFEVQADSRLKKQSGTISKYIKTAFYFSES